MVPFCSAGYNVRIFRMSGKERSNEGTADDCLPARCAEYLKNTAGKARADPLPGKFERDLGVGQDEIAIFNPVIGGRDRAFATLDGQLETMHRAILRHLFSHC